MWAGTLPLVWYGPDLKQSPDAETVRVRHVGRHAGRHAETVRVIHAERETGRERHAERDMQREISRETCIER